MLEYSQDDEKEITDILVGRRVVEVDKRNETLTLDDGTVINVYPNEGCGGCPSGYYWLESLSRVDNIITAVSVEHEHIGGDDSWSEKNRYSIFVFTGHEKINLLTIEGDDGNGYYGTGFHLNVKVPERS